MNSAPERSSMSDPSFPDQGTSAFTIKRALAAIDRLQRELDQARQARMEPIAVVGMGCRFPGGVADADSYWQLLSTGADAIGTVPADRWDVDGFCDPEAESPGTMSTRWGGFLDEIDQFDPAFFGISPREAEAMDPNQRLVLEVAWGAIEDAGLAKLAGTRTGVFVGVIGSDYGMLQVAHPEDITPYVVTGSAHSVVSGRLAYLLDLRGPAVSIDTACSSSSVAVHLACQSLRSGESDLALAGGVNVILGPWGTIAFSQFGMMSRAGRCKAFDAAADGFVRSEGAGMVVLKRLSDALADGDSIRAVIRGSAVNQDGRSTGLTAPNVFSQRDVLRNALQVSGIKPEQVSYIEAHGTGTTLGDPIEAEALAEVYPAADGVPWHLGSVKSNVGHLEAAAGVAGLMKVVLGLQHEAIPASLHYRQLNPNIALDKPPFVVPTELTPWQPRDGRRVAGVSGFGLSGTNVHLLVEQAPVRPAVPVDNRRPVSVLALSARTPEGLRALVECHRERLAGMSGAVADYCYSTNTGRLQLPCRMAVVGGSAAELAAEIEAACAGELVPSARPVDGRTIDVTFLFGDAPARSLAQARALLDTSPVFREAIERCQQAFADELTVPLLDLLTAADPGPVLERPESAQPVVFAVGYGLLTLWQSWGVQPTAVFGIGVGEISAALAAGVLDLSCAARLAVARGRWCAATARGELQADEDFAEVVQQLVAAAPRLPVVASVTGALWPWDQAPDVGYWRDQASAAPLVQEGLDTLRSLGHAHFVEMVPGAAALASDVDASPLCDGGSGAMDVTDSTREWERLFGTLADLYAAGVDVDWAGVEQGYARTRVSIPLTPFVRQRYWFESDRAGGREPCSAPAPGAPEPSTTAAQPDPNDALPTAEDPVTAPENPTSSGSPSTGLGLLTRTALLALSEPERFEVLVAHLTRGVQQVLGARPDARRRPSQSARIESELALDQPFLDLGLDSLMAMGLKNQIRAQIGVVLPIAILLQEGSIRRVANLILQELAAAEPAEPPVSPAGSGEAGSLDDEALLAELARLPEDQGLALLEDGR